MNSSKKKTAEAKVENCTWTQADLKDCSYFFMKSMKARQRYEEAKRLRDAGFTYKEVGEALGVSAGRVREMLLALKRKNQREDVWFYGLRLRTIRHLGHLGFHSRDDCMILAADERLTIYRGYVALPGWEEDKRGWRYSKKRISLGMVNEIRAWLGVEPYIPCQQRRRPTMNGSEKNAMPGSALKPISGEWVPVSDQLPNPGKMVLACYKNCASNWRIICGYWIPAKFRESDPDSEIGEYDEASDQYYDPEGWYERVDNWGEYHAVMVNEGEVSHWMPIPEPPTSA